MVKAAPTRVIPTGSDARIASDLQKETTCFLKLQRSDVNVKNSASPWMEDRRTGSRDGNTDWLSSSQHSQRATEASVRRWGLGGISPDPCFCCLLILLAYM